jgi:hypothetical protein
MQVGGFSDYRANKWLTQLSTVWIGLHYADPNISGAYASEVFGGSYARKKVTFTAPDARVMFNGESIVFKGLPSVRLTHIAGWDKQYNGNMEFYIPLTSQVTILAGKGFTIDADQLAINIA